MFTCEYPIFLTGLWFFWECSLVPGSSLSAWHLKLHYTPWPSAKRNESVSLRPPLLLYETFSPISARWEGVKAGLTREMFLSSLKGLPAVELVKLSQIFLTLMSRSLYWQRREQSLWLLAFVSGTVTTPALQNTLGRHLTFRNTLIIRVMIDSQPLGKSLSNFLTGISKWVLYSIWSFWFFIWEHFKGKDSK